MWGKRLGVAVLGAAIVALFIAGCSEEKAKQNIFLVQCSMADVDMSYTGVGYSYCGRGPCRYEGGGATWVDLETDRYKAVTGGTPCIFTQMMIEEK